MCVGVLLALKDDVLGLLKDHHGVETWHTACIARVLARFARDLLSRLHLSREREREIKCADCGREGRVMGG